MLHTSEYTHTTCGVDKSSPNLHNYIANFSFRVFYLIEQWKNAYTLYTKYMYVQDHHGDLQLSFCTLF